MSTLQKHTIDFKIIKNSFFYTSLLELRGKVRDFYTHFKVYEDRNILINYDKKTDIFEYYTCEVSNKSFFVLGGLYDPETGLFYIGNFKDRLNIPVLDMVEFFNSEIHYNISLDLLNRYLQIYKLTDDSKLFIENLEKYSDNLKYKSKIYLQLIKVNGYGLDYTNEYGFDKIYLFLSALIEQVVQLSSQYDFLLTYTLFHGKDNSLVINHNIKGLKREKNPNARDQELSFYNHLSRIDTVLLKGSFKIFFKSNDLAISAIELIPDTDMVYSSDPKIILRNYGFDKLLTEEQFNNLSDSFDSYFKTEVSYFDETISPKSVSKKKYTDSEAQNPLTMASILLDIKLINRNLKRIK